MVFISLALYVTQTIRKQLNFRLPLWKESYSVKTNQCHTFTYPISRHIRSSLAIFLMRYDYKICMHICLITTCPSRLFVLVRKSFTDFSSSFLSVYSQFPRVYYDNILIDSYGCCLLFLMVDIELRDMYIVVPP
jgi:hypothetical protein